MSVELGAAIVSCPGDAPQVLVVRGRRGERDALPSGPLEASHRTLEVGLRAWVGRHIGCRLDYVEQLYTFGDLNRGLNSRGRSLSVAYLALTRDLESADGSSPVWRSWYGFLPWEDWRQGRPAILKTIDGRIRRWAASVRNGPERDAREHRARLAFGLGSAPWSEERVLERYELLYEAGLVAEAGTPEAAGPALGIAMAADHRRILATAIGRLRGKIKYRPVVFELLPPAFTLLRLQRTVEALSGLPIHKQNFRRLVTEQGLVEETGRLASDTGGRPAKLVRFRSEVMLERLAPGVRMAAVRPD